MRRPIPLALAALPLVLVPLAAAPSHAQASPRENGPTLGLTIPWAVGGPRFERDGTLVDFPGEWTPFPVRAIRLWDTRTAWLNLEPRQDQFAFDHLDAHIAKVRSNGVTDITLVLAGTPRWAASTIAPTDPDWLGPGSASPPKDISDWENYVRTVATRYAGRIQTYEIGNEVNTAPGFTGSPRQWGRMANTAIRVITEADPEAQILVGGFAASTRAQIASIGPWLRAIDSNLMRGTKVSAHIYVSAREPKPTDVIHATVAALPTTSPVVVTEMNVRHSSQLTSAQKRERVTDLARCPDYPRIRSCYYYAWTDLAPRTLVELYGGTPGGRALAQVFTASAR